MQKVKVELYHDNFQNYKRYGIPSKAQLVIADICGTRAATMQTARANLQRRRSSARTAISTLRSISISVQGFSRKSRRSETKRRR